MRNCSTQVGIIHQIDGDFQGFKKEQNWVQENDFWTLTSEENRMKNVRKNDIIIAITEVKTFRVR